MSVFKSRKKAPPFCFSFFLIMWWIWWYNLLVQDLQTDEWGLPKHLHTITMTDIINSAPLRKQIMLHPFAYCGFTFFRNCMVSAVMMIYGYQWEYYLGTGAFLTRFVTIHAILIGFFSYFELEIMSIGGIEPTLVALQCIFHLENSVIPNTLVNEEFLQIQTFTVEPRWHAWILLFKMLLAGDAIGRPWTLHLFKYLTGMWIGVLYVIRYPRVWRGISQYLQEGGRKSRGGNSRFLGLLFLYYVALCYLPFTQPSLSMDPRDWLMNQKLSLYSVVTYVEPLPEALYLMRFSIAFLPFSVLWQHHGAGFAWVARMHAIIALFLVMYSMNLQTWQYINSGFLLFGYVIWNLFTLDL